MNAITETRVSRNYWWLLAIRGLLAVLFGIAAIVWRDHSRTGANLCPLLNGLPFAIPVLHLRLVSRQ